MVPFQIVEHRSQKLGTSGFGTGEMGDDLIVDLAEEGALLGQRGGPQPIYLQPSSGIEGTQAHGQPPRSVLDRDVADGDGTVGHEPASCIPGTVPPPWRNPDYDPALADDDISATSDLAAGDFSAWAEEMLDAIRRNGGSDVPCGGCTACCTSFQFVHIEPDETGTLARIPAELLFPAPGLPAGHVVLGYDERGHCPMLVDGQCSIYEDRPRTCRTYDCRVFPAAGVAPEGDDKVLIARRAQRWQFGYPTPADHDRHDAVRSAAAFLAEHADLLGGGPAAANSTRLAVLALEIHDLFLGGTDPEPDVVRARLDG